MSTTCPKCQTSNPDSKKFCGDCGTSLDIDVSQTKTLETPSDEFTRGYTFADRYEIIEELGRGGMGRVFRVEDVKAKEEIALKIIKPEISADKRTIERFRNELNTTRKIRHKNVCGMYDFGETEGTHYITMEYVSGEDLKSLLRRTGKLTIEMALKIAKQVCEGLTEAHSLGIIHRDLKPSNIMIDKEGNARIMDFGIARSIKTESITGTGIAVGTPQYMSPEQVEGLKADQRSDIYSFGIILYEMLTGKIPFEGDTPLSIALKHKTESPPIPHRINPQIPKQISALILKCLEKDKKQRFQSAEELLKDIINLSGLVSTTQKEIKTRTTLSGRRSKLYGLVFTAFAVVTITILIATFWKPALRKKPQLVSPESRIPNLIQQETTLVLIADFQNNTGEEVFTGAFEKALSESLKESTFISIYPRQSAKEKVNELDPTAQGRLDGIWAQLLSRSEGINILIDGSIEKGEDGYRINAWALDPISSTQIAKASSTIETRTETLKATDQIAQKLSEELKYSLQLHLYSTQSYEALYAFLEGQELNKAGKSEEAIKLFLRALEYDPNFGQANIALASIYSIKVQIKEADKYWYEALAHIDELTEIGKFRLKGAFYLFKGDYRRAAKQYEALLELYPADSVGNINLPVAYFYARDMDKAAEFGRRSMELNPKDIISRYNLVWYIMGAGDFETAVQEVHALLEIDPNYYEAYICRALSELAQGQTTKATETYQQLKLKSLDPYAASKASTGLADIAAYEGRLSDTITILKKEIDFDLKNNLNFIAADKYTFLAQTYMLQGKKTLALEAADRAAATSKAGEILFSTAEIYVQAGEVDKARNFASEFSKKLQRSHQAYAELIGSELSKKLQPSHRAYAKLIGGEMSMARGDFSGAIVLFQEAQAIVNTWIGHFLLGRAYLEAEAFTEAYSEFEMCLKRQGEATSVFFNDLPTYRYVAPVYYYLGRCHEGLGDIIAAIDAYQKFLDIKKNADPGLPEVDNAKKRLAGLKE